MTKPQKNVLGEDLEECSNDPLTGWFRDGCCNTDENDHGLHTVCVKVNNEFLEKEKKFDPEKVYKGQPNPTKI